MADVVDLRTRSPITHADEFNANLVQDLARFSEGGLITEEEIRRRYKFDDAVWESLANNESLLAAIEDEKTRRVRSGALKKERAQAEIVDAPPILGKLMRSPDTNARHVVDAVKCLDSLTADKSSEGAAAGAIFEIRIDLGGGDVLHFSKPIDITPNDNGDDVDDSDLARTPWGMFQAITAKKEDSGGGQGHL